MDTIKKCACCGKERTVFDIDEITDLFVATDLGAREYKKLWHSKIEKCFSCNYSSKDISTISEKEKNIVLSSAFKSIMDNDFFKELEFYSGNELLAVLGYAVIKEQTGEFEESGKAYMQASEVALKAYFSYLTDEVNDDITHNELQNRKKFEKLCEDIYNKSIKNLRKAVKQNAKDSNLQLLLIGGLLGGDDDEKKEAYEIMKKFDLDKLNHNQKEILKYFIRLK